MATVEAKASLLLHHANEKPRRRLIVSRGTAVVLRFLFFPVLAVTPWPSLIPHLRSIIEQIGLRYQAIIDFCGMGNLKMQANTLNVDETWVMISSGIAQRRLVWTVSIRLNQVNGITGARAKRSG